MPLDPMLEQYYFIREWDKEGIPMKELIEKLGINFKL
ncbi:MAG: aldehyde ferredoxin oxidoreductase C-terminal domain-containing protein [Candidatus Thorarchaeota archaeon]